MRVVLPLILAGCVTTLPQVEDPCATWDAPGLYRVDVPGFDRSPFVYVPNTAGPRPAVVMLHGAGATASKMMYSVTRFLDQAEDRGVVAVFPNGTGTPQGYTWNADGCCGAAASIGAEDVGFLSALSQAIRDQVCVERVIGAGHSNGGMMVSRWACEGSGLDAAYSSAGPLLSDACGGEPVAFVASHGLNDPKVPLDGGEFASGESFPPADEAFALIRERNGCGETPAIEIDQDTTCEVYECDVPTRFCRIEDWGHRWPGGQEPVPAGFDAEETVYGLLNTVASE